jgi:hypothetical protein
MTFVSVLIIDLFGRRVLHMAGMTVMFFSSILLVVFLVLQSNVRCTLIPLSSSNYRLASGAVM